jgi:hypothetical protein
VGGGGVGAGGGGARSGGPPPAGPGGGAGLRTCWLRRGPWGHLQELPEDVQPDLVLEGLGELALLLDGWRG